MSRLQKFWDELRCRWGFHDWTRWTNCQHRWDTWEFRACRRCPIRECRKTFFGVMADDAQFDAMMTKLMVDGMAKAVMAEFEEMGL